MHKQIALIRLRRFLNMMGLRKKKIFAIGYNKSGTTSLHALFQSLGLPSYHGTKWRECNDLGLLRSFDCFSDGIPHDLEKLDRIFPHSKFILQVRELEAWIYSRLSHIERERAANIYQEGNPLWDATEEAIKSWIKLRNDYHLFVLSYFSERPDDFLVVNFTKDADAANKICRFLGYSSSIYINPDKNKNPYKQPPKKHLEMVSNSMRELKIPQLEMKYDIYCPSLVSEQSKFRPPADTSLFKE